MGWSGPEAQVRQDLRDDLGLFDEGENPRQAVREPRRYLVKIVPRM